VYHIDLYRIEREDDLEQLGWADIISANALIIVEWPERAGRHLPSDHLPITLDYAPEEPARRLLLAG
jgi:tRNA threonylcarbamoyl adenosine modification protein YjeE